MSYVALDNVQVGSYNVNCKRNLRIYINAQHASCQAQDRRKVWKMRFGTSVCFGFWNIYISRKGWVIVLEANCGIYTTQGKRMLLAVRATVNGRKAVAYVKNGKLQAYEYLDDLAAQCCVGPCLKFEDGNEKKRM